MTHRDRTPPTAFCWRSPQSPAWRPTSVPQHRRRQTSRGGRMANATAARGSGQRSIQKSKHGCVASHSRTRTCATSCGYSAGQKPQAGKVWKAKRMRPVRPAVIARCSTMRSDLSVTNWQRFARRSPAQWDQRRRRRHRPHSRQGARDVQACGSGLRSVHLRRCQNQHRLARASAAGVASFFLRFRRPNKNPFQYAFWSVSHLSK